jgi:hypothetical protein
MEESVPMKSPCNHCNSQIIQVFLKLLKRERIYSRQSESVFRGVAGRIILCEQKMNFKTCAIRIYEHRQE